MVDRTIIQSKQIKQARIKLTNKIIKHANSLTGYTYSGNTIVIGPETKFKNHCILLIHPHNVSSEMTISMFNGKYCSLMLT